VSNGSGFAQRIGWAVAVALLFAGAAVGQPPEPNPERIEVEFYPFPEGGAVWSAILAHSSGKVYVGLSGRVGRLVEFEPRTKTMRIVARMTAGPRESAPVLDDDMTVWRLAHHKIHTRLHEGRDGRVYGGTHTEASPAGTRDYPGGHWFAYDPEGGKVEDLGWARRHEGLIAACYDGQRNVLYGLTWPTGYLVSCKPDEKDPAKRLKVLDLASSKIDCVSRYLEVVRDGRVYTADGASGDVQVYVPGEGRLYRVLGLTTPAQTAEKVPAALRESTAYRNWWTAGARSPDGMHLFTTGQRGGHLTEIDATQGKWGVLIDHGRTVPWGEDSWSGPYCGGMVFGRDGLLYHTVGTQLLTYQMKDGRVCDCGRTVLKADPTVSLRLSGGACAGPLRGRGRGRATPPARGP